jgi:hypothetical protein
MISLGYLAAENQHIFVESYATNVFHSAHLVIWAENLIKLVEGIGCAKHLFVEPDSFYRDPEPVVFNLLYVLRK